MAAAESVGVAARVTQMTVEYAKERKQFGRPIGSYQAVSHACAQMFLETEGARSVTYWAAWALDHDPETAFMAANCAKAYASDARSTSCRSALQVHGGIGFTWEHDLHLFLKRAEANAHAFGDARWHREQVADSLFSLTQEASTARCLVASSTVRPGAAVGQRHRARGLEHLRLRRAGGQLRADQAEQRRAGHVRADRLRRRPGDPRQADEGLQRRDLVLDRADDLLLAARAR